MLELIDRLRRDRRLDKGPLVALLEDNSPELRRHAAELAREACIENYGNRVFIRGLIEFTNYCQNDCFYCGIRRGNRDASRYRLAKDQVLACCRLGHDLGFRTFVLQGGEDRHFDDDRIVDLVAAIRAAHPDCAITLSIGEKDHDSYVRFFEAGADRYLLRHETADAEHYALLHPASLSLARRKECLRDLKAIGFQTGAGFMIGSPFQTSENIADDLLFLRDFEPQMVGLGPFIPHRDTPFADYPAGSVDLTLLVVSLVRLLLPSALMPATTALGTMDASGREKGILAGANVVMPNLSPPEVREKYLLYDNKLATGMEAAEHLRELRERMADIGYEIAIDRGDHPACIFPRPLL